MVKKIMTNSKKRFRKFIAKRTRIAKPMTNMRIHHFKRRTVGLISARDGVNHYGTAFTLASLPNYQEFTNLFDSYRINGVSVLILFDHNSSDVGPSGTNIIPNLTHVIDYDDANVLTAESQYLEYEKYKINRLDKPVKFYIPKPRFAIAAYSGAFTSYATKTGWVDCASPSVEHYGYKMLIDGSMAGGAGTNTLGVVKVITTYYISCKEYI